MIEISIVIPCLNESKTLATCIEKAKRGIAATGLSSEIIVADNGSTDDSIAIAKKLAVTVVHVDKKGYGSAIRGGIQAAQGSYIIMADADGSYDFSAIAPFIQKLKNEGFDLVIGNRFKGGIEPGAMPFWNRYLGTPVISWIGNMMYGTHIGDYNGGLRGGTKSAFNELNLSSSGMELASEMIVAAATKGMRITEIPITLSKDGRDRKPHLRPVRDGLRHLKLLVSYTYENFGNRNEL
jgi:glycosyltransferase involved in cell wall biosynthesis